MTAQNRNVERALARVCNPLTAIRAFCIQCMGGYVNLIPDCPSLKCPLYAYRMGRNPKARERGRPFEIVESVARDPAISEVANREIDDPG